MRRLFRSWGLVTMVTIALLVPSSITAQDDAQAEEMIGGCPAEPLAFHECALQKAETFDPSRTSDGKPDMQGYWRNRLTNGFAVEGIAADDPMTRNPVQSWTAGPGMIVDPPDGKIPYQPWAEKLGRRGEIYEKYIDPHSRCWPHAPPRNMEVSPFYQLLQPAGQPYLVWLLEEIHEYRIIPTDSRQHIGKEIKLWGGDGVGHWEGNTLVVDLTNFNGYTWLDDSGNFYTDAAHMIERWTMIDPDTIHYEVTIEDPEAYTRPWKMVWALVRESAPGFELLEEACWEGERDFEHFTSIGFVEYFGEEWNSR